MNPTLTLLSRLAAGEHIPADDGYGVRLIDVEMDGATREWVWVLTNVGREVPALMAERDNLLAALKQHSAAKLTEWGAR